jgi:flagellar biosynthetic protein FliP
VTPSLPGLTRLSLKLGLIGTGALMLALWIEPAFAQSLTFDLGDNSGSTTARLVQLLALMTVLSLAPSILVMVTCFTRIVVVLSFLRTAIGVQQSPPSTVIVSLALFLTAFVMAPTLETAFNTGIRPLINEEINEATALERVIVPFHRFMMAHVRDRDLKLFLDISKTPTPETPEATPLRVLVPSFMISELRRAFEIGFLLFIPFLIIDMVVASVLLAMGMMMLPPAIVSLPFKLIFFVLVDGWFLVAGSLVQSFGTS